MDEHGQEILRLEARLRQLEESTQAEVASIRARLQELAQPLAQPLVQPPAQSPASAEPVPVEPVPVKPPPPSLLPWADLPADTVPGDLEEAPDDRQIPKEAPAERLEEKAPWEHGLRCPVCFAPALEEQSYCLQCGNRLPWAKDSPPVPVAAEETPPVFSTPKRAEDPYPSRPAPVSWEPPWSQVKLPQLTAADLLGPRGLAWAGGLITLIGIVLFFVIAVNRGWVGPELRCALGVTVSTLLVAVGWLVRRRQGPYYAALAAVGAGIGGAYVTLYAATALYGFFDKPVALVLVTVIACVAVVTALVWESQLIAFLGLESALLSPLAVEHGVTTVGLAFAAFAFAGLAAVAVERRWSALLWAGFLASVPQVAYLALSGHYGDHGRLAVIAAFYLLYLLAGSVRRLREGRLDSLAVALILVGAALANAAFPLLRPGGLDSPRGWTLLVGALPPLLAGLFFLLRRHERDLATALWGVGLTLLAIACGQLLGGGALTVAWAGESIALVFLARASAESRFRLAAAVYSAAALIHTVAFENHPRHLFTFVLDPAHGSYAAYALSLALLTLSLSFGRLAPTGTEAGRLRALEQELARLRLPIGDVLRWLALCVGTYASALLTLQIAERLGDAGLSSYAWGQVGVTTLVGLIGWALLAVGLQDRGARASRQLRYGSLATLGVSAALLAFDAHHIGDPQRYWAGLAVYILVTLGFYADERGELRERGVRLLSLAGLGGAGLVGFWALEGLEFTVGGQSDSGVILTALALAYALLAALAFPTWPRLYARDLATVLWGTALVLAVPAAALLVPDPYLVAAYATTALALVGLGHALERRFHIAAGAYLALAPLAAVALNLSGGQVGAKTTMDVVNLAVCCAATLAYFALAPRRQGDVFSLFSSTLLIVLLAAPFLLPATWLVAFYCIGALVLLTLAAASVEALSLYSVLWLLTALGAACVLAAHPERYYHLATAYAAEPLLNLALAGLTTLAFIVFGRPRTLTRSFEDAHAALIASALVGAAAAAALTLHRDQLVYLLALAAVGLAVRARHSATELRLAFVTESASLGYLATALLIALVHDTPPTHFLSARVHPAAGVPVLLAVVAALYLVVLIPGAAVLAARIAGSAARAKAWLWSLASALLLYAVSLGILELCQWLLAKDVSTNFQRGQTAVSALWGLVGLTLLYLGHQRRRRALRFGGLALFGVAVSKLFLFDITNLSSLARVGSFLAVGVALMVASYFDQRLAARYKDKD
jgi:uncharacterized membrane protein